MSPATGFRVTFITFGLVLLGTVPLVFLMPTGKQAGGGPDPWRRPSVEIDKTVAGAAACMTRPAAAVDARKRRLLSQTALDYLKLLKNPPVKFRFDIVEVLLADGAVREVRHLPNTFSLSKPYRYA